MRKILLWLLLLNLFVAQAAAYNQPQTAVAPVYLSTNNVISCPYCSTGSLQMVGTRTGLNGIGGKATGPGLSTRIQHTLPFGAQGVAMVYAGWETTQDGGGHTLETTMRPTGSSLVAVTAVPASGGGGTGYAAGDQITLTTAANQFSPTLMVTHTTGGAITDMIVLYAGMFGSYPSTSLSQATTTGSGTGAVVTLGVSYPSLAFRVGLEQVWNTQTAYSNSALTGVLQLTKGAMINGAMADLLLTPGETTWTDVLPVALSVGATIGSRAFSIGGPMYEGRYLSTDTAGSALGESQNASVTTDQSGGGTFPTITGQAFGFQPLAIMGYLATPKPSWVIVGDSKTNGIAGPTGSFLWDTGDQYGDIGWGERALNIQFPWANFSTRGDQAAYWANTAAANVGSGTNTAQLRMAAICQIHPSHVLYELGVNDAVGGAASAATIEASAIAVFNRLRACGVKHIWAATLGPNTTSTDGWTTVSGQTVTSANTAIQAYNTYLKAGNFALYGVDQVVDNTIYEESTPGSGKWPANGTLDGLHDIQALATTMGTGNASLIAKATLN